jgi:hypothetical protein
MTEKDLHAALTRALPSAFSGLLDAISHAMAVLDKTPVPDVRMADWARWVVAAEPKLPWPAGDFLAALERNADETAVASIESNLVATSLQGFMAEKDSWSGSVSDLHERLGGGLSRDARWNRAWPSNPNQLGEHLRRIGPPLRRLGLDLHLRRNNAGSIVEITRL